MLNVIMTTALVLGSILAIGCIALMLITTFTCSVPSCTPLRRKYRDNLVDLPNVTDETPTREQTTLTDLNY